MYKRKGKGNKGRTKREKGKGKEEGSVRGRKYRARQLYKNISMLFLFPVKDGKLSTGVNATFNASCYG